MLLPTTGTSCTVLTVLQAATPCGRTCAALPPIRESLCWHLLSMCKRVLLCSFWEGWRPCTPVRTHSDHLGVVLCFQLGSKTQLLPLCGSHPLPPDQVSLRHTTPFRTLTPQTPTPYLLQAPRTDRGGGQGCSRCRRTHAVTWQSWQCR